MTTFFYLQDWQDETDRNNLLTQAVHLGIQPEAIRIESILAHARPIYHSMKDTFQAGDVLYVPSFSHLGSTIPRVLAEWNELIERKRIHIQVLNFPFFHMLHQNETAASKFSLLEIVCLFLYYLMKEEQVDRKRRQHAGLTIARKNGVKIGRKKIEITDAFISVYEKWKQNKMTATEAMKEIQMKPNTFYRRVKEYEARQTKREG